VASHAANRRGILAMLAAMGFFIGSDTLLKIATATCPPGQIMAIRGLFASLMALGLVLAMGHGGKLASLLDPVVLGRSVCEALVAFLYITSLGHLPLANITAILQATPIIMTLFAVLLGIEAVGWRRWLAVVVGFVGVLMIVRPTPDAYNLYAVLALGSAVLVAVRDLMTRQVKPAVPSVVVTLSTTTIVGLAGLVVAAGGEVWQAPTTREYTLLICAAAFVTLGNLGIILAFREAEIAVVSPFRYSIIVLSIVMGYLVFGEWPDLVACLGIALIMASGLYTIHREQVRRREALLQTIGEAAP
jgi:drug/metabolite transporter (DMT)-like permease